MPENKTPPTDDTSGPGRSLRKRVMKAGFWAFGLRAVDRLVWVVRMTLLARLLSPNEFGRFGIAMLALALVEALSRTGLHEALVQKDRDIRPYINTAWTIQSIRGLILALILVATSPLIGSFFREPTAVPLLRVMSVNALLLGLTNMGVVYFQKELVFHKHFVYMFSGTVADLVVSLIVAVMLRNAWALVWGVLAGNLVRTVVSHLIVPRVRFAFDREKAKTLARFGRWVWGSSVAQYVLREGDKAFVGRVIGTEALGWYRMASQYASVPAREISQVLSQVTFPAYAKLQHNLKKLSDAFLRTLKVTVFVSAPISAGIIVMAPGFVRLFLGSGQTNNWLPTILPLQILAVWGFIRSIGATAGPVFHGVGRPHIVTKLALIKLVTLAALIYPMTRAWGLVGTALAVVAATLINNPIADYAVIRETRCGVKPFLAALACPVVASTVMAFALRGLHTLSGPDYGLGIFAVSILVGVAIYLAVIHVFRVVFGYNIAHALRSTDA